MAGSAAMLAWLALLGGGLVACGDSPTNARSRSSSPLRPRGGAEKVDAEGDGDNSSGSRYDDDDGPILDLGMEASAADGRALKALVRRYYALGARGDGGRACPMIYSPAAESFAEDYGETPSLSGRTCATVLSKLFRSHRKELAARAAATRFVRLRVEGDRGVAMMSFGHGGDRYLLLHREDGVWKTEMVLDVGMP